MNKKRKNNRKIRTSTITRIESYIMKKVREKRIGFNFSPAKLTRLLNKYEGFVADVENPKVKVKYNINHINEIAKVFKCSPREFLPLNPLWPLPTEPEIVKKNKQKPKNKKS